MSDLVTKLVPILYVEDPESERRFYAAFGHHTTYEGPEYSGFIAVGNDAVEFGLNTRAGSDPIQTKGVLQWQLGVSDVDAVITTCERDGLDYDVSVEQPGPDWRYRIVKVRSPTGSRCGSKESRTA